MYKPWETDTPYTPELIARFNCLTHFPKSVDRENARFKESKQQRYEETLAKFQGWGHTEIPEEVKYWLSIFAKVEYEFMVAQIRIRELVPPVTVVGPSGYDRSVSPRKRRIADNMEKNSLSKIEWAQEKLRRAIHRSSPYAAIKGSDPDALAKLETKLFRLECEQQFMKACNKICRSKKLTEEQKIEQLTVTARDYGLMDENKIAELVHELLHHPRFSYYKPGFQSYQLSNNSANINRVRERIEFLSRKKATGNQRWEFPELNLTVVANADEDRLQVFFPKEDLETRTKVKSLGWRFSRTNECWQMNLSESAKWKLQQALGIKLDKQLAEAI